MFSHISELHQILLTVTTFQQKATQTLIPGNRVGLPPTANTIHFITAHIHIRQITQKTTTLQHQQPNYQFNIKIGLI